MKDLLQLVNAALRARGWSARQASIAAVGNDQLIRNMRRGQVPSVEKVRALCEVLGIEFYIGAPREVGRVEAQRLERAIETTERSLREERLELEPQDKAQIVAAVYDLIGSDRAQSTVRRVRQLITGITAATRNATEKNPA